MLETKGGTWIGPDTAISSTSGTVVQGNSVPQQIHSLTWHRQLRLVESSVGPAVLSGRNGYNADHRVRRGPHVL
jgi:hypothetical protein